MIIELNGGKSIEVSEILELDYNAGIYIIYNELDSKFYIGSTANLHKRKRSHFNNVKHGTHRNIHFQRAVDKYGVSNFKIYLIEHVNVSNLDTKEQVNSLILSREQYYMDLLGAIEFGYNICPTAGNSTGKIVSEETREKIRKIRMGSKHTPEARENIRIASAKRVGTKKAPHTEESKTKMSNTLSQKVVQVDLDNQFIKEWNSIREIMKHNPTYTARCINLCCNQKQLQSYGSKWFWVKDYYAEDFVFPVFNRKVRDPYYPIIQLTMDLEYVKEWRNSRLVSEIGMNPNNVLRVCRGVRNMYKGFKWMYLADYIKLKENMVS